MTKKSDFQPYVSPNIKEPVVKIWVVDRFCEGEFEDFSKEDLLDDLLNYTAFQTPELARFIIEREIASELDELKTDDPEAFEEEGYGSWEPQWEQHHDDDRYMLESPHDGAIYTVRPIPLYVK